MRASTMPLLKALLALLALALALPSSAQSAGARGHAATSPPSWSPKGRPIPGETLTLALRFTPEPGWHGYWSNPGDAGYGMRLAWHLPEGWKAGEPLYPVPHKLLIAGLMNHVYEGEYAVLVPIEVPAKRRRRRTSRRSRSRATGWSAPTRSACPKARR